MSLLKTKQEIERMKKAGQVLASCHREIAKRIKPGISTLEINQFVEGYLYRQGAFSAQKGYKGYPYATCASVNDVVCHGFPTKKPLQNGDIVTIDMVVNLDGALADSAWSYTVGDVTDQANKLLKVTKKSLYKGIDKAIIGNRIGDIGHAVQTYAEKHGFSIVREFLGHGIGQTIHEPPQVPHFGEAGTGLRLKEGMVITIEPILNEGWCFIIMDPNGWAARTADGTLSAQYEHTIAITKEGPLILTNQDEN